MTAFLLGQLCFFLLSCTIVFFLLTLSFFSFLQELFTSMVRRMFEEYKYFPRFPEKELRITGQLFGGIIDQGLVPYVLMSNLHYTFTHARSYTQRVCVTSTPTPSQVHDVQDRVEVCTRGTKETSQ